MRLIDADAVEDYIKKHIDALDDNAQHYSMESVPVEAMDVVLRDILKKVQNTNVFWESVKSKKPFVMNNFAVFIEWLELDEDDPFRITVCSAKAEDKEEAEKLVRKRLDNYRVTKVVELLYETN